MKPIRYIQHTTRILLLLSCILAAGGCSSETQIGEVTAQKPRFVVEISGADSGTRAVGEPVEEKITTPLHLFFYKEGEENPAHHQSGNLTDATSGKLVCTFPDAMDLAAKYDIYVIGCDANVSEVTAITTRSQLLELIQDGIADIPGKKNYILAGRTQNIVPNVTLTPQVRITRNVCRLELTLKDESSHNYTAVSISLSSPDKTFALSSDIRGAANTPPTGTTTTELTATLTKDATSGLWKLDNPLYFFENKTTAAAVLADTDKASLKVIATTADDKEANHLVHLNADEGYITQRNTIYRVAGILKKGGITISTEPLKWQEVTENIEPELLIPEPKANCYIMAPGGGHIYIPVAQINDANAYNNKIPAIGALDQLTADLLWSDIKGATSGKGMAEDTPVAAVSMAGPVGTGSYSFLKVTTGNMPGNAVVVVKDATGNIRWSWHIWVMDPAVPLEEKTYTNTKGTYTLMDRHLGATSITPGNLNTYGLAYQWGRKDPFPQAGAITRNHSTPRVFYNAAGDQLKEISEGRVHTFTIDQSIANPWLMNSSYTATYGWWCLDYDKDMWGDGKKKTVYDPCPEGWRVPEQNVFAGITGMKVSSSSSPHLGATHPVLGFFPLAGRRYYDNFLINNAGIYGFISVSDGSNGDMFTHYRFAENQTAMSTAGEYCESVISVRCVKMVTTN